MGGAGALRFCHLANFTLSFTPQIDLVGYEAVKRSDFEVRGCEERSDELRRRVDEILALIADTSARNVAAAN